MFKKRFKQRTLNRVSAAVMSGMLAASTLAPMMTPLTVNAADLYPTNSSSLVIEIGDEGPYGADNRFSNLPPNQDINYSINSYYKNLSLHDFVATPQGLGRFDKAVVRIYDVTNATGAMQAAIAAGYVPYSLLEATYGNNYKVVENRPTDQFDSSVINIQKTEFQNDHTYVIIEEYEDMKPLGEYALQGYYVNKETGSGSTSSTINPKAAALINSAPNDDESNSTTWSTWFVSVKNANLSNEINDAANSGIGWISNDYWRKHYKATILGYLNNMTDTTTTTTVADDDKGWEAIFTYNDNTPNIYYSDKLRSSDGKNTPLTKQVWSSGFKFNVVDSELDKFQAQGNGDFSDIEFTVYNISSAARGWSADGSSAAGYVIADSNNNGEISIDESKNFIPAYDASTIINQYKAFVQNGTAMTAIPVMKLTPDENGVVKTSSIALPVGNYLVVQTKAGEGYYLDEDAMMGIAVTNIGNIGGKQATFAIGDSFPTTADANNTRVTYDGVSKVAYVDINATEPVDITKTPEAYFASNSVRAAAASDYTYDANNINRTHIQSDGNYASVSRLDRTAGDNKFISYQTVIKGSGKYNVVDDDDVRNLVKGVNMDANGKYLIVPQGNGDINGGTYEIVNTSTNPVYYDGKEVKPNAVVATLTIENNEVVVPLDSLSYGTYSFLQKTFGEGYSAAELKSTGLGVTKEDAVKVSYNKDRSEVPVDQAGNGYPLVNKIIEGGELYTVKSSATEDVNATLKIYNISDEYVYVDGTRYETVQDLYTKNINGKDLTYDQVNDVLKDSTPCKTIDVKLNEAYDVTATLPYGTYLVVLGDIPDGYHLTGKPFGTDSVAEDGDKVEFTTTVNKDGSELNVSTYAVDSVNKIDSLVCGKDIVINDTVTVSNADASKKYAVVDVVIDSETGNVFNGLVAYKEFDTDNVGAATVDVNFAATDTSKIENKTLVLYTFIINPVTDAEAIVKAATIDDIKAKFTDALVATHAELTNEDQTVRLSSLDIEAKASISGGHSMGPVEKVVGTTSVGNLEVGNSYVVDMYLYDPDNNIISTVKGTPFVANSKTNTVTVTFDDVDASKYNNKLLTVYADLSRVYDDNGTEKTVKLISKGDADSMGYTPDSSTPGKNQVKVVSPTIKTVFSDEAGNKKVDFANEVKLVDTVTYDDLVVGGEYQSKLTIVNKNGELITDDSGKTVDYTYTFTATDSKMTVKLPVTFKGTKLIGTTLIAYNDLYSVVDKTPTLVAQEHELGATDQIIEAITNTEDPVLTSVAIDSATKTHTASLTNNGIINEVLSYKNFVAGSYTITTTAVDATTGNAIEDIAAVTTKLDVTDTTTEGTVGISLNVDYTKHVGQNIVIYDVVTDSTGAVYASHKEISNLEQTVYVSSIDTVATAADGKGKTIAYGTTAKIFDKVAYTGLSADNTYTVTTKAVLADGKEIASFNNDFTPKKVEGSFTIEITFDDTAYAGKNIVIYETITDKASGLVVADHKDLKDADQTVTIANKTETTETTTEKTTTPNDNDEPKPQTGVDQHFQTFFLLAGIMFGVCCLGSLSLLVVRRKKRVK